MTHLSLLSLLCLNQSYGYGFQWWMFSFIWVPELPTASATETQNLKVKVTLWLRLVSMSWCLAPSGSLDQIFVYCLTVIAVSLCGTLSIERSGLSLNFKTCPAYNISARTAQNIPLLSIAGSSAIVAFVQTFLFTRPLPLYCSFAIVSNTCNIIV
jgi:hypothetical protein